MTRALTTSVPRLAGRSSGAFWWLPAIALIAVLALSQATGRAPVGAADAATVGVTGSIASEVSVDASGCGAAAVAIGDILPGTDPWKTAQDEGSSTCVVGFGSTNNTAGTDLAVLEDPAAPGSPTAAMKCVVVSCSGDSIADYQGGAEPAAGTSAFGAQLLAANAPAAGVWGLAPSVYDIQDSGDTACQTSNVGSGSCEFTFGATASDGDVPGAYQAQAQFIAIAR